MTMTKIQRKALDLTLEDLAEDLDVIPAIIHLKSKELFTDNDDEAINTKPTRQEKVTEFVKLLKMKGSPAFDVFQCYLKNYKGASHLADELAENLQIAKQKVLKLQKPQLTGETEKLETWRALEEKFFNIPCKYPATESYQHIPLELNILLIGKTGSGKSSTGNTLLGYNGFSETSSSKSVTKTITTKKFTEGNKVITVIDTPGLFDTDSDFKNEDLVLEIAKTMIDFRKGIHLFLLVCGSHMRFTKEEEDTIKVIEKILTNQVYENCILVLSNAYSQFGCKDSTIETYIAEEKKSNGKFSNVIRRVNDRVIAVENFFPDEFLKIQHRQKLLCVLMQVISDNNGSCYSNKLFKSANAKVEREEQERMSRIKREEELTKMKNYLGTYLLEKHLLSLSVEDLCGEQLLTVLESNIDDIMHRSMVSLLGHVKKEDVKRFLKEFVNSKKEMIETILAMKLQEKAQENEIRKKNMEIKQKESNFKMQSYVLSTVTSYLKKLSKSDLRSIQERQQLPSSEITKIMKGMNEFEILIEQAVVESFITETFFATQNEIEKFINEKQLEENLEQQANKMRVLENDHKKQRINEKLCKEIPKHIENSSDKDLNTLKCSLQQKDLRKSRDLISNVAKSILKDLPQDHQRNDTTELVRNYFLNNIEFVMSSLTTTLNMRETKRKMEEQKRKEEARTNALKEISEIIKSELKQFLQNQEQKDLQAIEEKINKQDVPSDILKIVRDKLKTKQLDVLDEKTVEIEILKQVKEQKHIIDDVKKESGECFAGSNCVVTKQKGLIKISDVQVNDEVLAIGLNGHLFYDKVYLISHANREEDVTYIKISTKEQKFLLISPDHLLPVNGLNNNVPAKQASVGDTIFSLKDEVIQPDIITSVSYQRCKGAYCPMTMNGTIVVNEVAASCFTTFLNPRVAHTLLLPFRIMFRYFPKFLSDVILPYEPVEGMPVVLAKCRSAIMFVRSTMNTLRKSLM